MDSLPPFIVAIPARYASTRLPGKPLRPLAGDALIRHVVRRGLASGATEVVVASESRAVLDAVADMPVRCCLTSADHASGSDRLAECASLCGWDDDDAVVNLQGDEPFAPIAGIQACVRTLVDDGAPMATLATALGDTEELFNPDCVKLVRDARGRALYFSRAPIPWARDAMAHDRDSLPSAVPLWRHIGLYAYRAGFLRHFAELEHGALERAESLEQLRALEHGHAIAVREFDAAFPPGIDNPADLERAEQRLREAGDG